MVWYFIGVYKINRTLHDRLEIRNFFSRGASDVRYSRCRNRGKLTRSSKTNYERTTGELTI